MYRIPLQSPPPPSKNAPHAPCIDYVPFILWNETSYQHLSLLCVDKTNCDNSILQIAPDYSCSWARIFRRLFLKRCTFGSKSGNKSLVSRYQAKFAKNCSRAFEGLSYFAYKVLKNYVIFFIHIIK